MPEALHQAHEHVGHRRPLGRPQMQVALQRAVRVAHEQERAAPVVVQVGVAHRGTPDDGGLVEQRRLALHRVLHLLQEVRHLPQAIRVDDVELHDGGGDVAVVRRRVEGLAGAAVGEGVVLQVEAGLEGDDPGQVRLQGEHLQVEHQPHVVFPAVRDSRRGLRHLPLLAARVLRLHQLDAPLQLADVGGVLIQRLPVQRPQLPLQVVQLHQYPVEQALAVAQPHGAVGRGVAGAEQLLEHPPGLADGGKRLGGRRPRQGGRVRAVVVVGAAAPAVHLLRGDLERGQGGVLPEAVRVDLVEGLAQVDVGLRLQRMSLGEEHGGGAVVVSADLLGPVGLGHAHVGVADDGQVVPVGLQRLELALRP